MTMAGCSDSLDDIRPKDQIPSDSLTENDLAKVLNGVYATMEDHVHNMWWDGDIKGENYRPGPGGNLSDPLDMSPSTSAVRSRWNNCFTSLKQVNFLIENYETNSNKESATVKQSGGTGYFFRALIYYNAVTRWGKAPILRKRTYDDVPLSGEADVWAFILEDLDKAEKLLPPFTDRFYVSASACDALKARVYIAIGDQGQSPDLRRPRDLVTGILARRQLHRLGQGFRLQQQQSRISVLTGQQTHQEHHTHAPEHQ